MTPTTRGRNHLQITHFTDPACPFAFTAERVRWRLLWHYGHGLEWTDRMVVLSEDPDEPKKLAQGAPNLQREYGMPIDPRPKPGPVISRPACAAFVAARVHAPDRAPRLLRALRVRTMAGGVLDDPELIAGAARDAGLEPGALTEWTEDDGSRAALDDDIRAARALTPAALALVHRLGGGGDRYATPTYELRAGETLVVIPGFNPYEVYEAAIGNLAPELDRRPEPESVTELLEWAGEPLATAEIVHVTGLDPAVARAELARAARFEPAGADGYWSLSGATSSAA